MADEDNQLVSGLWPGLAVPPPVASDNQLAVGGTTMSSPTMLGPYQGRYSYSDLVRLAQNAGFKGQAAITMAGIALAESGGNPAAINPNDPQGSYGLLQINQAAHPGTQEDALNPQKAFELAFNISKGGADFSPWSTYKSGAYRNQLNAALEGTGYRTGMGVGGGPSPQANNLLSPVAAPSGPSAQPSMPPIVMGDGEPTRPNPLMLLMLLQHLSAGGKATPIDYDPWKIASVANPFERRIG